MRDPHVGVTGKGMAVGRIQGKSEWATRRRNRPKGREGLPERLLNPQKDGEARKWEQTTGICTCRVALPGPVGKDRGLQCGWLARRETVPLSILSTFQLEPPSPGSGMGLLKLRLEGLQWVRAGILQNPKIYQMNGAEKMRERELLQTYLQKAAWREELNVNSLSFIHSTSTYYFSCTRLSLKGC